MRKLDLSANDRREVESEIWRLKETVSIPVGMAPGYFSERAFFPCGPLELEEYNLDYKGNLTLCCQLSGHSAASNSADVVANLRQVSLTDAIEEFRRRVGTYLKDKQVAINSGRFGDLDYFPCWYCLKYLGNTSWLDNFPNHPWSAVNKIYKETHTSC